VSRIRWQSVATGYLGIVVAWTVVQSGPAKRAAGLADTLTKLIGRLYDPEVAGIPNKHDGQATDVNQTSPPGSPDIPASAGPAPNCPPGFEPRYDRIASTWRCIGDVPPGRGPTLGDGGGSSGGGSGGPVQDLAGNPPGRGLTTITAPDGERVTVAANYAAKFSGLLRDLWNEGYHFRSVSGYSNRNIAGTNTKSKHATGEAIDIDPTINRGTRLGGGGTPYGEFRLADILPLLRKYNLDWGGLWKGQEDPMHFSTGG
jgi:hypothetical protein